MTTAAQLLIVTGALFMFLAALGLVRFPDLFTRMHAATKAASLAVALVLAGSAWLLDDGVATAKLVAAIVFQLATAPVAAHVVARAGYSAGVGKWEETGPDDLLTPPSHPPSRS